MNERQPIYRKKVTPFFTATGQLDAIYPDYPTPSVEQYLASRTKKKSTPTTTRFGAVKGKNGTGGVKVRKATGFKKKR